MADPPKDRELLLKILNIIGYSGNKESYTDEFLRNIPLLALEDLILTLLPQTQQEIKQKLSDNYQDPEMVAIIVREYFSDLEFQEALKKAAKNAITNFIQKISNTLSDNQKDEIIKLFEELNQT